MSLKRCCHCGRMKPKDDFNRCQAAPDGRDSRCRRCLAIYQHGRHHRCGFCGGVNHRTSRFCSDDCKKRHGISLGVQGEEGKKPRQGMLIAPQGPVTCEVCGARARVETDRDGMTVVWCPKDGARPLLLHIKVS
jgi:hypothetical protein